MVKNSLEFIDQTERCEGLEGMFSALLNHIAKKEKLNGVLESLAVVGDEEIAELNARYRKKDRPTDVLSFSFEEGEEETGLPFRNLGEVIISLDTSIRQAEEFSHPTCREMAFLFIHGTLHNLGYDHARGERDAEVMFALQNEILNSFRWDWEGCRWPKPGPKRGKNLR